MNPLQIALIVLVLAGVWAVVELALVLRSTRGTVDALNKTVGELNETVNEARPMVAKLDGAVDEIQPALAQVEPLIKQVNTAVEALTADLVEVNGVLRDVSQVTGTVSNASGAVSNLTDAAAEKVSRLFGKKGAAAPEGPAPADRTLTGAEPASEDENVPAGDQTRSASGQNQYYTYGGQKTASKEEADD